MYPNLEITWKRGHDPEMEVWDCHGQPPSLQLEGPEPGEPRLTIDLSPFSTKDMHFLVQCHGIRPGAVTHADLPRLEASEACKHLPEGDRWYSKLGAAFLVCLPLYAMCRFVSSDSTYTYRQSLANSISRKQKKDDVEGDANPIGAAL
eukprot:TRINITY_DN100371_c0_g1_i1.p1 TRINITY_DN100371_c0_g1~~TRINITY_DN100371_c0_g1_i1.p1  ORF type:complete len:148 (+),score=14.30 TRINITY_DN100371_c0_g1_i1:266-709(+)